MKGVTLGAVKANLYDRNRFDLSAFVFDEDTVCAGVFTTNAFCAAPVHIARERLGKARAWLINTKSANAGTGDMGRIDAEQLCAEFAAQYGLPAESVLPFSTGVIGERLPMEKLTHALPALCASLRDDWDAVAQGILTTDTTTKHAMARIETPAGPVQIRGVAKGSGMIEPNMATMLGFVVTDAKLSPELLQDCLKNANQVSFNRIVVDGDTSTNDACMVAATGAGAEIHAGTPSAELFLEALSGVLVDLAQSIVRDGEGATKFVAISVTGCVSETEAEAVAKTIARSPLVKTALYASDANWGRILAAVGRAPVADLDVSQVSIDIDDVPLVRGGAVAPSYTERKGAEVFAQSEISVSVDLGRGDAEAMVWTCDLSHEYVSINADYRS